MKMKSQDAPTYVVAPNEDAIIEQALTILSRRMGRPDIYCIDPGTVRDYLRLKIGCLEHESFQVVFLDSQNGVIVVEEVSRGTLNQAAVYPREVVKAALAHNAGAVIFAHNHPSGKVDPSDADKSLTRQLRDALALVDVRTLDHIIVAGDQTMSFAERGLI